MRLVSLLAAVAVLAIPATPVLAGSAETAFLSKLAGTWTGGGTITGGEGGAVSCTLTFKGTDKVNFSGVCNAGKFGPQNNSGFLTYNDKARQYLARSNGQTVAGVKAGSSVVFASKMKSLAGTGNSVMKISAKAIVIDVDIVRSDTGDRMKSHITFTKS